MVVNYIDWKYCFEDEYFPKIKAYIDILHNTILPVLDPAQLNKKAEEIANSNYAQLMSGSSNGNDDPGDYAGRALDGSIEYFGLMYELRQGLINSFAVAIWHLHEQYISELAKNIAPPSAIDANITAKKSCKILKKYLFNVNIDLSSLPCTDKIKELELTANAIKHGEGWSARELRKQNPHVFQRKDGLDSPWSGSLPIRTPLGGEGIYLEIDDLRSYAQAIKCFWNGLFDQLNH